MRRAALAHDLGRAGVSNSVWEKPGPLGFGDWERVRLHPHFTERAFAQSRALAPLGLLAGSHHERLDGSGYHRGVARAGARPGGPHPRRRRLLWRDARGAAAPAGAGCRGGGGGAGPRGRPRAGSTRRPSTRCSPPRGTTSRSGRASCCRAGLTDRELEVLLALARGRSNQTIADGLGISVKTVGHHVEHVYLKAGVRSRAAATLWAFDQHLVGRA